MKVLPSIFAYIAFVLLLAIMPVAAQHNGYADWLVTNFWLIFFFLSVLTFLVITSILVVQKKKQGLLHSGVPGMHYRENIGLFVFHILFFGKK